MYMYYHLTCNLLEAKKRRTTLRPSGQRNLIVVHGSLQLTGGASGSSLATDNRTA